MAYLAYFAVVAVIGVGDLAATVHQLEECTNPQQRSILSRVLNCEPRETVVQLELPNDTYVHVAPSQVAVQRCGGSCHNRLVMVQCAAPARGIRENTPIY